MKHFLTLGILSSMALVSVAAHAEQPFTAGKAGVGAGVGYGVYTGDGDLNPYGLGFGARGGYTLDSSIHIGASFEYYLGGEEGPASFNVMQFMLEPGYDLSVSPTMVVRPSLGIGMAKSMVEVCIALPPPLGTGEETCVDDSSSDFAVAPGAFLLIDFGGLYGQVGARYNHIFVDEGNADGFLLTGGVGIPL